MDGDSGDEMTERCSTHDALLDLMDKTGYDMVQENGQRKFGGPPPGWEGPPPPRGCEVFVGKIPSDMFEDELVPVFARFGRIYEFRLMMEFSGENRGYAFVMYTTREAAKRAIHLLDSHQIRPGKFIGVCVSLDNCRLFIGSIPKEKRKEDILEEMRKVTDGVVDVIVYPIAKDKSMNRGFAFVEYDSHKAAAMALRKLKPGTFQLWGHTIRAWWAEKHWAEKDVDEDQAKLLELMDKTGYKMVQENGQRKFGGPPPGWEGPPPPRGCEVFVGKIPRDMIEDELVPVFERAGRIYQFRLMMEFSGENRGYAFVMYTTREAAQRAIHLLDNREIRPGKFIGVCVSLDNCRLFIGSIPKEKRKEDILEEMRKVTDGVVDVIVYPIAKDKSMNRGFAFVEYDSHKAAAMALRKLKPGTFQLWGHTIRAYWAEKDVDEEAMLHMRVLYVRNLMVATSEDALRLEFSRFKPGAVERVKKHVKKDYALVHYHSREDALAALHHMNGALIDGAVVEVTLAKPVSRDGAGGTRRCFGNRGYTGVAGGGGVGGGVVGPYGDVGNGVGEVRGGGGRGVGFLYREDGGMGGGGGGGMEGGTPLRPFSMPHRLGSPFIGGGGGGGEGGGGVDLERCVYPFIPGASLTPTSLHSLKPGQFCSAVSLLDFYCHKNSWDLPEYHLYSTPGLDGKLLLIYKVVISPARSSFMPDKVCSVQDDAKELAAQNAFRNLDYSFLNEGSPGSLSPPPTSTGLLACGCRAYTYPAYPLSPLSRPLPLTAQTPQRLFIPSQSGFF